ncbi:hypothetical protein CLIB1423_11S00914 [[Candida] railenensis]|uniref:Uncharacterized protein n=1 Tax=[Candida] railenensis TaxID=45579 RepID=A0A9P0QR96_9ASCO|nr:hypothetical protein CLIB1423_11S00914 [[Candida] railenensis]
MRNPKSCRYMLEIRAALFFRYMPAVYTAATSRKYETSNLVDSGIFCKTPIWFRFGAISKNQAFRVRSMPIGPTFLSSYFFHSFFFFFFAFLPLYPSIFHSTLNPIKWRNSTTDSPIAIWHPCFTRICIIKRY